ncbi:MAG: hypothetical protein HF981_12565 [Desulfobacteraceae bacterium]|nr:hypothetical protein [Desulfobacteraceae bacterium]MBC2751212.1 hypothetical protein [Desulfobacteraceae bacterium]
MEKAKRTLLLVACVILLTLSSSHAEEIQPIDRQDCDDPYTLITKAAFFPIEEQQLTIRLFETGGGDPAINGNKIVLSISQWDSSGNSFTWHTGIDIYELIDVRLERGRIWLDCLEHAMDSSSGAVETLKTIYTIAYFHDTSGQLKNTIDVTKQE